MRFLLDENVSPRTAALIKSLGLDVIRASETELKGSSDEELYEYCKNKHCILVTFDHEFGFEYISRKNLEGLIIIRVHPQTIEFLHPILENFFSKVKSGEIETKGSIIVIEKGKVRIRKVV